MLSVACGGCAADWDSTMPAAPPGGAGLMAGGVFAEGPQAVSAASQADGRRPDRLAAAIRLER